MAKKTTTETRIIPVYQLEINRGQIYGLPKNPRFIKDKRFEDLKKSIQDDPEMMNLRELIVYPIEDSENFIIIGGNMRFRACQELGWQELPCRVLPKETPVSKLRAYTIKDNAAFGENDWDALANDWDLQELKDFGMDDGFLNADQNIDDFFNEEESQESDDEKDGVVSVGVPAQYSLDIIRDKIKAAISEFPGCEVK